jgi:hypothetical protein
VGSRRKKVCKEVVENEALDTAILKAEDEYHNVRSQLKNSKAKSNIEAVEKGYFGEGH